MQFLHLLKHSVKGIKFVKRQIPTPLRSLGIRPESCQKWEVLLTLFICFFLLITHFLILIKVPNLVCRCILEFCMMCKSYGLAFSCSLWIIFKRGNTTDSVAMRHVMELSQNRFEMKEMQLLIESGRNYGYLGAIKNFFTKHTSVSL